MFQIMRPVDTQQVTKWVEQHPKADRIDLEIRPNCKTRQFDRMHCDRIHVVDLVNHPTGR